MAVPKKKTSTMKKKLRRSHHALKKANFITCVQCGEPTLIHRVCPKCNTYRGKKVIIESQ